MSKEATKITVILVASFAFKQKLGTIDYMGEKRKRTEGRFRPSILDRVVLAALAFNLLFNGIYLAGPWYEEVRDNGDKAPLYNLFDSGEYVGLIGATLLITGAVLVYSVFAKGGTKLYTQLTSNALLVAFLVRLHSLIGVLISANSWKPPTYTSHLTVVVILAAYWVWVKVDARTTR